MSECSWVSGSFAAKDLDVHLARFLEDLERAGYAVKTLRDKRRLIAPFIQWASDNGIATCDLDETRVDTVLSSPSRRRSKHRTALKHFIEYLRFAGSAPPRRRQVSPGETLIQRYFDYLRDVQGLSPHSLAAYTPFVRSFVAALRLPECAEAIDALAVRAHVLDGCRDYSVSSVKLQAAALRSFMRFCFLSSTTARNLSIAVLPVGRWQAAAAAPRLTAGEEVEQVTAAVDRSTP